MDNFEQLSNTELRDKLKAHDLGNFPVTDTTRNALIKKLRNAINGPAPKSVKARRETLAVVKHSSPEESESDAELKKNNKPKTVNNRRATIAASSTASKASVKQPAEVVTTKVAPVVVSTSKANGIANDKTPVKAAATVRSKSPSRKPELYFDEVSDDDLIAAAAEFEKQARRKTRTSRSPSLTKSSVVTTSYKHTIEPLIEQNDDVVLINDNSDAEYSSEMLEKVRKPSTPTTKINPPADSRRKTMQLGPSISTNYSSIVATEKPIEDTGSAYRRRYTTYASPSTAITAPQNTKGLEESNDDFINKIEAPFLSDFTRRLAKLKAEQLPGTESFDYRSPKTTSAYLNEYRSSIYGSGRVGDRYRTDKPITSQLKQQEKPSKLAAFEKKFRLPIAIILAILIAVVVYVFLFSNF